MNMFISKAIRMNILQNPTGKKGHGCGVDWIVEHNNLYTKVSIFYLTFKVGPSENNSTFMVENFHPEQRNE